MKVKKVFLISIIVIAQWYFHKYFSFGNNFENLEQKISFFLVPTYILLLTIFVLKENYTQHLHVRTLMRIHVIILVLVYLILTIVVPLYISSKDIFTREEKGKILKNAYEYAEWLGEKTEMIAYLSFYNKYKESITGFKYQEKQLFSIPNIQNKIEKTKNIATFYDLLITNEQFKKLNREKLLFNAKNFLETSHYYTAKILLVYYREVFGEDEQLLITEKQLNEYSDYAGNISYEHLKNYQNIQTLTSLYTLVNNKILTNSELILIYNMLRAIIESSASKKTIKEAQWIEEALIPKLENRMFFVGDARIKLFRLLQNEEIVFIEKKDSSLIIWTAENSSYDKEANLLYFKNLELISISQITNTIEWHLKTPYAKLQGTQLYLLGIERYAAGTIYQPYYLVNNQELKSNQIDTIITTNITAQEASRLQPHFSYIRMLNIIDLIRNWKLWDKYFLPIHILLKTLIHFLVVLGTMAIFGTLILKWSFQVSISKLPYKETIRKSLLCIIGLIPLEIILENSLLYIIKISPHRWNFNIFFIATVIYLSIFIIVYIQLKTQIKNFIPLNQNTEK